MNEKELEALVMNVKAISDRLTIVDKILKERGAGVDMVLAFQCGHSRLYYPADYVKEWGKLYGIGLGPDVCSEALNSAYDVPPPAITPAIRSIDQIMHPLMHCRSQMDTVLVERSIFHKGKAVLGVEDGWYQRRAPILRNKQLQNPRGQVRILQMRYEQSRNLMEVSLAAGDN